MGLFSFIKEAGEKLFGIGEAKAETAAAAPAAASPERVAELNKAAGDAIAVYIQKMGLPVNGLAVAFDGATAAVTVSGTVADQATKEKVVLCCGNVQHVSKVNDMLTVETPQPESQMHVVEKGDNLSKISAKYYGTPNKYMVIFEANKPMLSHPDKIYPGQALRIPPAA
jgi:nucleoid-associated protein YgaU